MRQMHLKTNNFYEMKLLIVFFVIAIAWGGCSSQKKVQNPTPVTDRSTSESRGEQRVVPQDEKVTEKGTIHIVREGESLSGIAQQYGVTLKALVEANGIENPDLIFVNQKLVIPPPKRE